MEKEKQKKENFIPLDYKEISQNEMLQRSQSFFDFMNERRSVREFSERDVPIEVVENIIKTASTSPSGAHKQPWKFCVIKDAAVKKSIRKAAEEEEYENYNGRMSKEWLNDLEKFDTDWHKPFLEVAPYLIVVFKITYDLEEGDRKKNYYVNESVGLACGILLAAIHNAGLVALTHTPSPMNFLSKVLNRSANEKPFLLIPVGYPPDNVMVPKIKRKSLSKIMSIY